MAVMKTRSAPSSENGLPTVLTAIAVAIGALFAVAFPWSLVALYASILPVPLLLLWLARDVPSPRDRIAAIDAEHAALTRPRQAEAHAA